MPLYSIQDSSAEIRDKKRPVVLSNFLTWCDVNYYIHRGNRGTQRMIKCDQSEAIFKLPLKVSCRFFYEKYFGSNHDCNRDLLVQFLKLF